MSYGSAFRLFAEGFAADVCLGPVWCNLDRMVAL